MGKIISLSGRIGSGKSELGKICIERGYKRLYFGFPLKDILREFFNLNSIDELNDLKNTKMNFKDLSYFDVNFISEKTGIPFEYCQKKMEQITPDFTMRDWLQFIGTDLIRSYDFDWHVKKTLQLMNDNDDYIFDDTRFPNEITALINKGAKCYYVVRPKTDNVSNHPSETQLSLESPYFTDNIIINDKDIESLKSLWINVLDKDYIADENNLISYFSKNKESMIAEAKIQSEKNFVIPTYGGNGLMLMSKEGDSFIEKLYNPIRVELLKKYIQVKDNKKD